MLSQQANSAHAAEIEKALDPLRTGVDLELLADPAREVSRRDLGVVGFSGARLLAFVDDSVSELVALRIPAPRRHPDVIEIDLQADYVFRQ